MRSPIILLTLLVGSCGLLPLDKAKPEPVEPEEVPAPAQSPNGFGFTSFSLSEFAVAEAYAAVETAENQELLRAFEELERAVIAARRAAWKTPL